MTNIFRLQSITYAEIVNWFHITYHKKFTENEPFKITFQFSFCRYIFGMREFRRIGEVKVKFENKNVS